ncbi:hypothetical protein LINPERPRIM_LOCUS32623 [Linum perenne]
MLFSATYEPTLGFFLAPFY